MAKNCPSCGASIQSSHEPKIKGSAIIQVHGYVMLNKVEEGLYRVVNQKDGTYNIFRQSGKKPTIRHYCKDVDPWITDNPKGDSNYIKIVKTI